MILIMLKVEKQLFPNLMNNCIVLINKDAQALLCMSSCRMIALFRNIYSIETHKNFHGLNSIDNFFVICVKKK